MTDAAPAVPTPRVVRAAYLKAELIQRGSRADGYVVPVAVAFALMTVGLFAGDSAYVWGAWSSLSAAVIVDVTGMLSGWLRTVTGGDRGDG